MYSKLRQQILPELIPPHARILVAVSGGPDSVALAHILWRYGREVGEDNLSLVITHVHHGVRRESDYEEKMVKDLAAKWGIPCLVHHFDAKTYAKLSGRSFQEAAREWRYAQWKKDMRKEGCTLLATAHHLGDQAETVLYRLLRGSGTAGLAGIYPRKGEVIRPLLSVSKEEILEYCHEEQLPYALDQSNTEPVYVRNKIRLQLLPELEKNYNPRIQEALARTSELLRWDEEYLSGVAEEVWDRYNLKQGVEQVGLRRNVFQEPKAILSRVIRKAISSITGEPRGIGFTYVGQIMNSEGQIGWSQDLPGLHVFINEDGIWFRRVTAGTQEHKHEKSRGSSLFQPVRLEEWVEWEDPGGRKWKMGLFEKTGSLEDFCKELMDQTTQWMSTVFDRSQLEAVKSSLVWRNRQPGDRMWLRGVGHKSLKKVFQEEKVRSAERSTIPLLALDHEILWIPGVKRADYYSSSEGEKVMGLVYLES